VARGKLEVGSSVLLRQNLNCREEIAEAGAFNFIGLLFLISFSDEQKTMTLCEGPQGGFNRRQKLNLGASDGFCEGYDTGVFFWGNGFVGELLETVNQRSVEAGQSVPVFRDCCVLAGVENLSNLFVCVDPVVKIRDECCDGAFKVNVVFPEGIVGIEEEGLLGRAEVQGGHQRIIGFELQAMRR